MDLERATDEARLVALHNVAERCKRDLFFLCKYILAINPDLITENTHRELCEITKPLLPNFDPMEESVSFTPRSRREKSMSDQFDPYRNKLLILMPRGTFKSSIVTIGFTLQYFLNDSEARILIDSETYSKSKDFLSEVKGHFEDNKKYRDIFKTIHGVFPDDNKRNASTRWTDKAVDLACRKHQRKEPSLSCSGIDRSINGLHFDLIIEDDLHSEKNITSKEQIQQVIDHRKLATSLLDPGMPRITIGTRWDYQDAYQHILDNSRDSYNIIIRKAIEDDGSLLFPERLTIEFLNQQKRDQGTYIYSCNPAGSKITMADWSKKNIEDIKPGDEVVGWNLGTRHNKSKLKPSKVIAIGNRLASIVEVTLASGRKFKCTPDHKWYVNPNGVGKNKYLPAKVGRKMMVLDIPDVEERDEWLGGMFDGEGSCGMQGGHTIKIAQSRSYNPQVCAEIERKLDMYGFKWGYNGDAYWINGGLLERVRFLRLTQSVKSYKILNSLWIPDFIKEKDTVVSIEPAGEEIVYSMQTETGNYICHNILSRNCQYQNEPVDDDTATFKKSYFHTQDWALVKDKPINWFMAVDPSAGGEYADYAAFVLCGMDTQNELYIRQIHRAKMNYAEIISLMFDWNQKYNPRRIALETVATQKSIEYTLNNEQKRRSLWMPVAFIKTRDSTKKERIEALAPYYEFGRIHHVKECNQLDELEYELLHFPKATHDDVSDALATILDIATPPKNKKPNHDRLLQSRRNYEDKPRSVITGI